MKNTSALNATLLIVLMVLAIACEKETIKVVPSLTTAEVTNLTFTTATGGGNITNDGGAPIIAQGVCWSTSPNPTIADSKTTDGTGTGSFTSSISGLLPGTAYNVRAYATNSVGTGYGSQKSFSTRHIELPTVTTTEPRGWENIDHTTVTSGGEVISEGSSPVTARGVCWSTSPNPTIDNDKTSNGNGEGSFTSGITGLTESTKYYIRAYATNQHGTSYGESVSCFTLGTLLDREGYSYTTEVINGRTWMVENLAVTEYRNGDPIPNVSNSYQWGDLSIGAYSNYNNSTSNGLAYGRLYNWYAVNDTRKIAPEGWHVASGEEWAELLDYGLDGTTFSIYLEATGYRSADPVSADYLSFSDFNSYGYFWTSNQLDSYRARCFQYNPYILVDYAFTTLSAKVNLGLSVRCVKDY